MPLGKLVLTRRRRLTEEHKRRMQNAIAYWHYQGIYPSAGRINQQMGRKTKTLNGAECRYRREVFKSLGIQLKSKGNWAEDTREGGWW